MMRGMVLLHYGMMVVLFAVCWQLFYRHAAAGSVFGAVDISVYAFYAVSLGMLSRIYGAYRVGLAHVGELLYGQVLANLISLAITYILACALARKVLNPLAGFGCAAVQALFNAGWTVAANQLYFSFAQAQADGGDLPGRERSAQAEGDPILCRAVAGGAKRAVDGGQRTRPAARGSGE